MGLRPCYQEEDRRQRIEVKDQISRMPVRAMPIPLSEDEDAACEFLIECDQVQDTGDAIISRPIGNLDPNYAGLVLTTRYLKRVANHAGNVVTSVILPRHKLDFSDEG